MTPPGAKGGVDIGFDIFEGVKLEEVEVVGVEVFEGTFYFELGGGGVTLGGFAGEKAFFAEGSESGAEDDFGVAVRGGDVEVVDAAFDGLGDDAVGVGLLGVHDDDAAKADDREREFAGAVGAGGEGHGGSCGMTKFE